TPTFDIAHPETTGVSSANLYNALAALPCRKLVLLDACHSYGSSDFMRELAPSGVGPVIISACASQEEAQELPTFGHGLFTQTFLEACEENFDKVDRNKDGALAPEELYGYATARIPAMIQLGQTILG